MHTQPTSAVSWPEEIHIPNGIFVASGYGLRISVWRGRLRVEDGVGRQRRTVLLHRATSELKRLVVIGHTGFVSLDAIRWLADIKAAYLQIDADGRVLATFGPPGTDRPSLRRAQAVASQTDQARVLSQWLVDAKLRGQLATLRRFAGVLDATDAVDTIDGYREAVAAAGTTDELRIAEGWAAATYWQALAPLETRFARRDAGRVAAHWRTFGGRGSPLANGPRLAANPANAVLNYLYALLESEATLAARIVGLDPGLGVMHVDQPYRDSLALDLMEPIRPLVDAYGFDLLTTRSFAVRDFFETRAGVCRVTPPLTHELAETIPQWGKLVGRVAEDLAVALEGGAAGATPITGRRRSEGRPQGPRVQRRTAALPIRRACSWCGSPTPPDRATCSEECAEQVLQQTHAAFALASSERMRRFAASGEHPALTPQANGRRRETRLRNRAAEVAWEREHPEPVDQSRFTDDVLPLLQTLSASKIAQATGLSVSYCADIKRGKRVPHPRWWDAFTLLML